MKRGWAVLGAIPVALAGLACWITYILTETTDFGELAALLLFVSGFTGVIVGLWSIDEGPIQWPFGGRRLNRAGRKALKRERQRVLLEQSIDRLEREVRRDEWS